MRKKWLIVFGAVFLAVALATVGFAASPIKLIVNGQEIKPDVPPQLINGRTMVPIRWVAEALGADVQWDAKNQQVKVNDGKNIWNDPVNATDSRIRDAIAVVSRYLSYLIGYSPEDLSNLATSKALDTSSPTKILQPFMLTGERSVPRFEILDVREADNNVEIAVRRYEAEKRDGPTTSAAYYDEVYTVIWETRSSSDGKQSQVPLIDGVKVIGSGSGKIW
ncbi:MAG: copper amine oxidase N-terminal domain-containing protein [Clostridia bacterium]|nr:MAG: copper amine oxidase N-terminal domain-containing protein [Clostridia bacterium]